MSLCHAVMHDLGGKCACVSPCHWGKESLLVDRADRGGQLRLLLEPNLKDSSKIGNVGSSVAA